MTLEGGSRARADQFLCQAWSPTTCCPFVRPVGPSTELHFPPTLLIVVRLYAGYPPARASTRGRNAGGVIKFSPREGRATDLVICPPDRADAHPRVERIMAATTAVQPPKPLRLRFVNSEWPQKESPGYKLGVR